MGSMVLSDHQFNHVI